MYKAFILYVLLSLSLINQSSEAIMIGDVTTTVRQETLFFPSADVNNRLFGFTMLEKGLVLQDQQTLLVYDGLMPIKGYVILNGGTIILNRDLELKDPSFIGAGKVDANNYSIHFNSSVSPLALSPLQKNFYIKLSDQDNLGSTVNSIDWSYDDSCIAVVVDGKNNNNELQIFSHTNDSLQLVGSQDFAKRDVNSVRWHPSQLLLAIGQDGSSDLEIYQWNNQNKSLTKKSGLAVGEVNAVAWHPSGNYLAVGKTSSNSVLIYTVVDGVLSNPIIGQLPFAASIVKNGLSWSPDGRYLAIAAVGSSNANLCLYELQNSKLLLSSQAKIGAPITSVQYGPDQKTIALGCSNCGESFKLFSYDEDNKLLTELQGARVGELKAVNSISWLDANFVAYAKVKDSSDNEIKIIRYDSLYSSGSVVTGFNVNATTNALQWSHSGAYLVTGGDDKKISLFKFVNAPLTFKNARLFFNSDVNVNCELRLEGNCVINGGNNLLDVTNGSIKIMPGAQLTIESADVKGVTNKNISCVDNTAQLILNEVNWIQKDVYVFDAGSLTIRNRVQLLGDNSVFSYESSKPLKIRTRSQLQITDLVTFNYLPQAGNFPIQYSDSTAEVVLMGGILRIQKSLLEENNGKIIVQADSSIITQESNQVTTRSIGQLDKKKQNKKIQGAAGVSLLLKLLSNNSVLKMNSTNALYLYDAIDDNHGSLNLSERTTIINQFTDPKI